MLTVKKEGVSKPIVYEGYEEIVAGFKSFCEDSYVVNDIRWNNENTFLVLVNTNTKKVFALRDFGKFKPKASDFLFKSGYVPVNLEVMCTKDEMERQVHIALDFLQKEVHNAMKKEKKPLCLVEHLEGNRYRAWSLLENKSLIVDDFKENWENFEVVVDNGDVHEDGCFDADEYVVVSPSDQLIKMLGLEMNSTWWKKKCLWDSWYKREAKEMCSEIKSDFPYFDMYRRAVDIINRSYEFDFGHDEEFFTLENRVERLERLVGMSAPKEIIEREIELIERSVVEMEFVTLDVTDAQRKNYEKIKIIQFLSKELDNLERLCESLMLSEKIETEK